ncbi:MAG: four-carbon acid sugar kinase family protein [Bryobacteraceae bacterium]|jgi:uncharacterized protein YgbK (DUF1537 family)
MSQGHQSFLAFADDLTGALEVGAKFAAHGIQARVTIGWEPAPAADSPPVRIVDLETRHVSAAEAARRVDRLVRSAADAELLYAKTDSTLRGNIGSQLGAMLEAAALPLLYVPAYPAMGRTVVDGRLLVLGTPLEQTVFARDALNPTTESRIVEVLRRQTSAPVWLADAGSLRADAPAGIYISNGTSDEDVAAAARFWCASGWRCGAGPAAFAEAIAERIDLPRSSTAPSFQADSALVVNGSLHEVSLRQIEQGLPDPHSGWTILEHSGLRGEELGREVRELVGRSAIKALIVFGGDTAFAILEAFGKPPLEPLGELLPGIPISRLRDRTSQRDLLLITKAGGFGPPDVLARLRDRLTGRQP